MNNSIEIKYEDNSNFKLKENDSFFINISEFDSISELNNNDFEPIILSNNEKSSGWKKFKVKRPKSSILFEVRIQLMLRTYDDSIVTYKGIINEGGQYYFNSLIQILYMLPLFTQTILSFEIYNDKGKNSSKFSRLSSLKTLLNDLNNNYDNLPISSNGFLSKMGISNKDDLTQNYIKEFSTKLGEVLEQDSNIILDSKKNENIINNQSKNNIFKYLFEGKFITKIKGNDIDNLPDIEDSFSDIELDIKGCKNLNNSLDNLTHSEMSYRDNKIQIKTNGKSNIVKYSLFSQLPKILLIQLKRFEYLTDKKTLDKNNDEFAFYPILDMRKYSIDSSINTNTKYQCRAVAVHKGSIDKGHYFCYIKDKNDKWYKFDDENVSLVYEFEVFINNYGGKFKKHFYSSISKQIEVSNGQNKTNAYLLVYIREDCIDEIYLRNKKIAKSITSFDNEIISTIKEEKSSEKSIQESNSESNDDAMYSNKSNDSKEKYHSNIIKVYIISRENAFETKGLGFILNKNYLLQKEKLISFNAKEKDSIEDIAYYISKKTNIDSEEFNIFFFNYNGLSGSNIFYLYKRDYALIRLSSFTEMSFNKKWIFFFIHLARNSYPLIKFQKGKWEFNKRPFFQRKSKDIEKKKMLLIVKYPVITYLPSIKEVKVELYIDNIYLIYPNDSIGKILFKSEVKENFFKKYYNNAKYRFNFCFLEEDSFSESDITFLIESSSLSENTPIRKSLNAPTYIFDGNFNSNSIQQDAVCVIINITTKSPMIGALNQEFRSFKEIIDSYYT